MKSIDLNCDMGELPEAIVDGTQEALMHEISFAQPGMVDMIQGSFHTTGTRS